MITKTIENHNVYIVSREELKNKSAQEFKDGDIVICNKYYIQITYGNFKSPSLLTTVSTREDIRDLPMSKQPYYIRDFIDRRIEDLP